MSEVDTANLLTILGCADIFTRLIQGFFGDCNAVKKRFRRPHKAIYTLMASLAGTSLIGMTLSKGFYVHIFAVIFFSFGLSGMMINSPWVYSESFKDDLPSALGLASLFRGLFALVIGPIHGTIKEHSEHLIYPTLFLVAALCGSMLVWVIVDCNKKCTKKTQSQENV